MSADGARFSSIAFPMCFMKTESLRQKDRERFF